jgi:pimeloyl-ACP methyl ester carboxylesterase
VPNDTVRVPYLVRVPAGYSPTRPAPVVVYLHGGVVSTAQFQYADPDVVEETIFAAAPDNAIVVYPLGRKAFGWVSQPAAFTQVEAIVREVQVRYHTDPRGPVLGGMSNGGSAALWFASQRPAAFRGFFAFSPAPRLPLGATYGQLGQGKPCYQLSAQDDTLYPYAAVKAAYEARPAQARRWELQTVAKGGHGFLYGPEGPALLRQTLARLCAQP